MQLIASVEFAIQFCIIIAFELSGGRKTAGGGHRGAGETADRDHGGAGGTAGEGHNGALPTAANRNGDQIVTCESDDDDINDN